MASPELRSEAFVKGWEGSERVTERKRGKRVEVWSVLPTGSAKKRYGNDTKYALRHVALSYDVLMETAVALQARMYRNAQYTLVGRCGVVTVTAYRPRGLAMDHLPGRTCQVLPFHHHVWEFQTNLGHPVCQLEA